MTKQLLILGEFSQAGTIAIRDAPNHECNGGVAASSGHYRRHYLPVTVTEMASGLKAALSGRLEHRRGVRHAVQRLLYMVATLLILLMLLSGFAIWMPVQLYPLTWLFGGYDSARVVHFLGMAGIVGFVPDRGCRRPHQFRVACQQHRWPASSTDGLPLPSATISISRLIPVSV